MAVSTESANAVKPKPVIQAKFLTAGRTLPVAVYLAPMRSIANAPKSQKRPKVSREIGSGVIATSRVGKNTLERSISRMKRV